MKSIEKKENIKKQIQESFKNSILEALNRKEEYRGEVKTNFQHLIDKIISKSKDGDRECMRLLLEYSIGKPTNQEVNLNSENITINILNARGLKKIAKTN